MNSFGQIFRINIFGESHGNSVGICIDGCPAGIPLTESDFLHDIERRKSGKNGTTTRRETDFPEIISGVFNGFTCGAPITIIFKNTDVKSTDYLNIPKQPRPSHADFAANIKFNGFNDYRGGGHFSGRLTLPIVAAGVIAKKILKNIEISARILEVNGEKNYNAEIEKASMTGDSVGGIVECVIKNIPIGVGEPFFNSVESQIAHLAFSIPAIRGIEFGAGFAAAQMYGSQHNDPIINKSGKTKTNNAGGIVGGITNGNDLIFRVAVKPASSINCIQKTLNTETEKISTLQITGRHDVCIALRVPVVIEAIAAISITDFILMKK